MKKCFGVLCAAMVVFCIVGTADATLFGFGRCFGQGGLFGGDFTPPFGNGLGNFHGFSGLCGGDFTPPFGNGLGNFSMPFLGNGPIFNFNGHCGKILLCEPRIRCDKPVPEPVTMLLLGGGLAGLALFRRKIRRQ